MAKLKIVEEKWEYIPNTDELFSISNLGNVKRFDKRKQDWVNVKPFPNAKGIIDVSIGYVDGKRASSLGRLVATIFLENDNPIEKKHVVHIDSDKTNNVLTNLKWTNTKEWVSRTHWERLETRNKTLEEMKEKAQLWATDEERIQKKRALISKLKPDVETWAFLPDSDNKYEISSFGRVKSYFNSAEGILRKLILEQKTGAQKVEITLGKKKYKVLVHRLVAEVFVENSDPVNKTMVIHIDGDKGNNHAENLKWIGHEEWLEMNKKRFTESTDANPISKKGNTHLNMDSVRLIRKLAEQGVTNAKLAKLFRVSSMQILRIKKNECWKEETSS